LLPIYGAGIGSERGFVGGESRYRYKTDIRSEMRGGISMARIQQIILHGKKGTNMQIYVGTRQLFLEAETPEELGTPLYVAVV
jgi:hypothetical protein